MRDHILRPPRRFSIEAALARIERLAVEHGWSDAERVAAETALWLATHRRDDGVQLRA